MFRIAIPQPCHQNWQKMPPTTKGAFCKACAKEVVDFTKMTDDEVRNYLLDKTGEKLCGRFQPQQLSRIELHIPAFIFTQNIAGWKKYLAIVLLAFGTMLVGCDVKTDYHTVGELAVTDTTYANKIPPDSLSGMVGALMMPPIDSVINCEPAAKGEIAIFPDPDYGIAGGIEIIQIDSASKPFIDTMHLALDTASVQQLPIKDTSACGGETYW